MDIIIGIHLDSMLKSKYKSDLVNYFKSEFKKNKKTYFFLFEWDNFNRDDLESVKLLLPQEHRKKLIFISIIPEHEPFSKISWATNFKRYEEQFDKKAVSLIKNNLRKGELINIESFGGTSDGCYMQIIEPAVDCLKQKFGEKIINKNSARLEFMHGPIGNPHSPAGKDFNLFKDFYKKHGLNVRTPSARIKRRRS